MVKRKCYVDFALALLGETPTGVAGVLLQWLTLTILVSLVLSKDSLTPQVVIALTLVGVSSFFGGIVLSIRGHSLGPMFVIPAAFGIMILVILVVLLYPLRWVTKEREQCDPPNSPVGREFKS